MSVGIFWPWKWFSRATEMELFLFRMIGTISHGELKRPSDDTYLSCVCLSVILLRTFLLQGSLS
jgi:hypothetical protein